jgi:hypothetical protein
MLPPRWYASAFSLGSGTATGPGCGCAAATCALLVDSVA